MDTDADYGFLGETANDQCGVSVAPAGDVDGDGHTDLLFGAATNGAGGTDAGKSYLMTSATITNAPVGVSFVLAAADYALVGESAFSRSGRGVGSGDVDGDGRGDVVIGAPNWSSPGCPGCQQGRGYVAFGATLSGVTKGSAEATLDLSSPELVKLAGPAPAGQVAGQLGFGVTASGDIDGDSRDDLLLGAVGDDRGTDNDLATTNEGRVYLVLSPY